MGVSTELINQFVRVTSDKKTRVSESIVLGTVVIDNGKAFAKIDGSTTLTPIKTTTSVNDGDRVTVLIKDHTATITGNITSPSLDKGGVSDEVSDQISEFEIIITDEIVAQNGKIDNLISENIVVKDTLYAANAEIENLIAQNVDIKGKLTATEAEIKTIKAEYLTVETAKITFATIEHLEVTDAKINNLTANFGEFADLTAEKFTAVNADIKNLKADKLSATEADLKYASIDFANIDMAAVGKLFAESGIIKDLVVGDSSITGELVGVKIKGDLIEAGTLVADKLVLKGKDGLYYNLNVNGEKIESSQTEYNSISGSVITAKSITASKVNVNDLVAFDATIGGFKITESSIYSGVKESVNNTTKGIYMDNTGQIAFGDMNNYIKFYLDDLDKQWKLSIAASAVRIGVSGTNVEDALQDTADKVDKTVKTVTEYYAINDDYTTPPTDGWSINPPQWVEGMYIWNKQRVTLTDDTWSETDPVCVTGAKGSDGSGVASITAEFYLSSSKTTQTGGSWKTTPDTWVKGKYMWTRQKIVYKNPTSTSYTTPVCETSWEAATDVYSELNTEIGKITAKVGEVEESTTVKFEEAYGELVKMEQNITNSYESALDVAVGKITTTVSETYAKKDDLSSTEDRLTSKLDQTSKDLLVSFTKSTDEIKNGLQGFRDEVTTYIRFDIDGMELGKLGSRFKTRLTNEKLAFLQDDEEVAYISNNKMYITDAEVRHSLILGDYSFVPRSNGNLSLKWIK